MTTIELGNVPGLSSAMIIEPTFLKYDLNFRTFLGTYLFIGMSKSKQFVKFEEGKVSVKSFCTVNSVLMFLVYVFCILYIIMIE